ncbi:MAG TPA: diguanylate cyclase, partial [Cyclobacteriaceae bacterium]|nr:diguanylate cyclase [Cyclobacteriaceae bacterium]
MVWSLYQDREGIIWIGTHNGGLTRYDKKTNTFSYYRFKPEDESSLSNQIVWTTLEDSQGRFWVGTSDGLNLMDRENGTFKRYHAMENQAGSLTNDSVLSMHEDKKNRLWFGTDIGLHLYNEEKDTFKVYTTRDGLADNGIRSITEDASGNLWMATNNGISMFNPDTGNIKNFQAYNRKKIGVFDTGSGMTLSTGEVVFGGENGLRIFNPEVLNSHENDEVPVVLTDFTLFTKSVPINGPEKILGKVINQTDQIVLDYNKSMFSFKFAALNYRDPDKNRYAYQLEGFDDVWREVGNQRTATYTNIAPGTYHFRVKASTGTGQWSTRELPLKIIIEPPPWRAWWAYCGYVLLIVLAFYFRAEHRRLRESAEIYKTQSVTDALTHIYNRAGIDQITSKLFEDPEKSKDTTVMLLDIDHFKRINDNWGHDAGDYILANIANTIVQNVRRTDHVGRWGGEEIVLICPSTTQSAATLIAEKLRGTIAKNVFELNAKRIPVTVSIGVAIAKTGETFEAVFKRADIALYRAKSEGRN